MRYEQVCNRKREREQERKREVVNKEQKDEQGRREEVEYAKEGRRNEEKYGGVK